MTVKEYYQQLDVYSKNIGDPDNVQIEKVLDMLIHFGQKYKVENIEESDDSDGLLFQYGVYNNGSQNYFELDFTRQLLLKGDDEYHQLSYTLYYKPESFNDMVDFNLWSFDYESLDDWKQDVIISEGFQKAQTKDAIQYKLFFDMT